MAFAPYVTTAALKTWVTIFDTVDDTVIDGIVISASRWIDEFCDRHFWQDGSVGSEVARTFTACSPWSLGIDDLTSITTLKTDAGGDGTFETTWAASDYQLCPVNRPTGRPYTRVEAVGGQLFPIRYGPVGRADRVEVTGVWGWPAVPDDVVLACKIQSARLLGRRRSPEGVTGGFGDFGPIRVSSRTDPDAEALLRPYRRTAVLVA